MQTVWDYLVSYAIGLAFYACYLPLLASWTRMSKRVPPAWTLALARWVVVPALVLTITWWLFGWSLDRVFVCQVSYYAATLFRLLRVLRGRVPTDEQMMISLFISAHGPEFQEWLEKRGYHIARDDEDPT